MNIFKTMAVKDLEQASRAIPVIDVARAFVASRAGSMPSPPRSGARASASASSTWPATACPRR